MGPNLERTSGYGLGKVSLNASDTIFYKILFHIHTVKTIISQVSSHRSLQNFTLTAEFLRLPFPLISCWFYFHSRK
jgi:hypothetical protein